MLLLAAQSVQDLAKAQLVEVVLFDGYESIPESYEPPPPHENAWNGIGHSEIPNCEYIDLNIRSPLLSERSSGLGTRQNDPD